MQNQSALLFRIAVATWCCASVAQDTFAQDHSAHGFEMPEGCPSGTTWSLLHGMCTSLRRSGEGQDHRFMFHANAFGVLTTHTADRGHKGFASPNMAMLSAGMAAGENGWLSLDTMLTLEKWTMPEEGYPLLLQTGEKDAEDRPYRDAQHPHSSPIMGLTFEYAHAIGSGSDVARFFVAPRGQATEGPIAFMHRPAGMLNPDAPLGHHIGQDAGHISSSVVGTSWRYGTWFFEGSTFSGEEPRPTVVDLPVATPDSWGVRVGSTPAPRWLWLASLARVHSHSHESEHSGGSEEVAENSSEKEGVWRVSGSLYRQRVGPRGALIDTAFILGLVRPAHEEESSHDLRSVLWEISVRRAMGALFGRFEGLERTVYELDIRSDATKPSWVYAATLGASRLVTRLGPVQFNFGGSVTKNVLPERDFRAAYGGEPWTFRIFVQTSAASHHFMAHPM